jgi:hypothetical protein
VVLEQRGKLVQQERLEVAHVVQEVPLLVVHHFDGALRVELLQQLLFTALGHEVVQHVAPLDQVHNGVGVHALVLLDLHQQFGEFEFVGQPAHLGLVQAGGDVQAIGAHPAEVFVHVHFVQRDVHLFVLVLFRHL